MSSGGSSESTATRSRGLWDGVDMAKFDQSYQASIADSDPTAGHNPLSSLWDQIAEKGKSLLDASGKVVSDVLDGRAMAAAEKQANKDQRDTRRFQAQMAADNLANGWVDDGLVMRKIGPVAAAIGPEVAMPGRENSFEQVQARSLNDAMQLAAADALLTF